jgi:hypothetical protein
VVHLWRACKAYNEITGTIQLLRGSVVVLLVNIETIQLLRGSVVVLLVNIEFFFQDPLMQYTFYTSFIYLITWIVFYSNFHLDMIDFLSDIQKE